MPREASEESWARQLRRSYPEIAEFAKLLEELRRESDRGVVLIMSGFLEQQLKDLLVGYLLRSESTSALLEGPLAPITTFAARSHACHALGLISDDQYFDLEVIRKIRNKFAHQLDVSFQDQSIVSRCQTFKHSVEPFFDDEDGWIEPETRVRFTGAAMAIILSIWLRLREVEEHRLEPIRWRNDVPPPTR